LLIPLTERSERIDEYAGRRSAAKPAMMNYLLDALHKGEDVGHYGRLTFAMVAHHFLDKAGDTDEQQARALVQQDFPICPNPDDPDACNVYNELQFPDEVYESIGEYQDTRAGAPTPS
jgi:hypothetical protein